MLVSVCVGMVVIGDCRGDEGLFVLFYSMIPDHHGSEGDTRAIIESPVTTKSMHLE